MFVGGDVNVQDKADFGRLLHKSVFLRSDGDYSLDFLTPTNLIKINTVFAQLQGEIPSKTVSRIFAVDA